MPSPVLVLLISTRQSAISWSLTACDVILLIIVCALPLFLFIISAPCPIQCLTYSRYAIRLIAKIPESLVSGKIYLSKYYMLYGFIYIKS